MILGLILLLAIVAVATVAAATNARRSNRVVKLWWIIVTNGVVTALTVAVIGAALYGFQVYRHDTCVKSSANRHDYRVSRLAEFDNNAKTIANTAAFYDVVDAATRTTEFTATEQVPGRPSLRSALEDQRQQLIQDRQTFETTTGEISLSTCPGHP